jgi:tripartite-type tricarboxylate transporter receptor subunit TctC
MRARSKRGRSKHHREEPAMKKLLGAAALLLLACGAVPSPAAADAYPSKPIRMIVAYGPGSGADIVARILAQKLGEQMNVSVYIENRDGGGGVIGTTVAAKSPPDGYTILLAPTTLTVSPSMQGTPPYDPVKDFTAVTKVAVLPMAVVTAQNAPYKTLPELIAYAKANPGKLMYATSGKGSPSHLEMELLKQRYALDISDVPYKSFGQAITDTMNGQVSFYFPTFPSALSHIKDGRVRGLATGAPNRSEQAPELPTVAEALGLAGYEVSVWYGVVAPSGTAPEIVAKLNDQIQTALKSPEVQDRIMKTGAQVSVASSDKFAEMIRAETGKWTALVKELGLKATD